MFFLFGYPFIFLLPFFLALLAVRAGSRYFNQSSGGRRTNQWGLPNRDVVTEDVRGQRIRGIEARVFKLAYRLHGRITVSDVVVDTGLSVDESEQILERMVDNQRVRMEVDSNGLMIYEFPELIARLHGGYGPVSDSSHRNAG